MRKIKKRQGKREQIKNKQIKIKKKYIAIITFIVLLSAIIFISIGKYISNTRTMHIQGSQYFYFESDILNVTNKTIKLDDWDTANEIYTKKINLRNYIDNLQINASDIEYNVDVLVNTPDTTYKIFINGIETTNGILQNNVKEDDEIQIELQTQNTTNINFDVTINSISPYSKTLVANFDIYPKVQLPEYVVNLDTDHSDYARCLIQSNTYEGNIKIAYNANKTYPDLNYLALDEVSIIPIDTDHSYIEIELEKNTNYEIDFVKKNLSDTLTLGNDILLYDIVVGYSN